MTQVLPVRAMSTRRRTAMNTQTETQCTSAAMNVQSKSFMTERQTQPEPKVTRDIYKKTYPLSDGITNPLKVDPSKDFTFTGNTQLIDRQRVKLPRTNKKRQTKPHKDHAEIVDTLLTSTNHDVDVIQKERP